MISAFDRVQIGDLGGIDMHAVETDSFISGVTQRTDEHGMKIGYS